MTDATLDNLDKTTTVKFSSKATSPSASAPILSIVAPVFNEELCLREFYAQVSAELEKMGVSWEIVFVDDGSVDASRSILLELRRRDERVKVLGFSRNFGNQAAIFAGLFASSGAATIVMDADLQQPPATIPVLFYYWQNGYRVVEAARSGYGEEASWFKRFASKAFYRTMNALSDVEIEPNAREFRLYDRRVIEALRAMPERARFLRAMTRWLGFKRAVVPYEINERFAGKSSFSTKKLLYLALDGIFGFSTKPLRWILYLGFAIFLSVLPYGAWALFEYCVLGAKTPGWTSLVLLNMLIGGGTLISLGVVGEYVGRIYNETKRRPLYVVEDEWGVKRAETPNARPDVVSVASKLESNAVDDSRVA